MITTSKTNWQWIKGPGVGTAKGKSHLLTNGHRVLCTLNEWRPGEWHWQTYDGKNTRLAGEPPTSLRSAKAAAMKWAKEHTRI